MDEGALHIRAAGAHEISMLAHLIRDFYRDVAERFKLTSQNCPKHPSNCTRDWVEQEIKTFSHLPFQVSLLSYRL